MIFPRADRWFASEYKESSYMYMSVDMIFYVKVKDRVYSQSGLSCRFFFVHVHGNVRINGNGHILIRPSKMEAAP